ncbi:MAG: hypothetical protein ABSH35_15415 [Isosphaeraceae bacterium]
MLIVLDREAAWGDPEIIRFLGLMGKRGIEAHFDPELNSLFHAFDALGNRIGHKFWNDRRDGLPLGYIGGFQFVSYREIAPAPSDKTAALILICSVIEQHVGRLEELLAEHEQIEAAEAAERYDRAALDCSPAFERHRRYQSARHRELLRTLETLRKMQKEEFGTGSGEGEKADGKCQMADGKCQMADDKCQMADDEWQMTNDEWQVAEGKLQVAEGELQVAEGELQVAGGELKMGDEQCEVEAGGCDEGQSSEPMTEGSSGPVGGHDSQRVTEDATDDTMGILSHGGAHAAGQPGQGDGVGKRPPPNDVTPQKAPNKANLESKQGMKSQELKSETAGAEGRKQSQSSKRETRRMPSSHDGRPARQSGRRPVASAAAGSELLRPAGVSLLRRSDGLDSPGDGQMKRKWRVASETGVASEADGRELTLHAPR